MAESGISYSINLTEWGYEKDEAFEDPILRKLMQFAHHSQSNIKNHSQIDAWSAAALSTFT